MVKEIAEKDHIDGSPTSELSENLKQKFRLGDITWVKISGSSWWPAQVIDEASVSEKPKKKAKDDALVRLYGTCQHLYVDAWKCNVEFETMLKQENKNTMEAFQEALEQELCCVNYPGDSDGEALESKGGFASGSTEDIFCKQSSVEHDQETTKVATARTSSRQIRKQQGPKRPIRKNVKESATVEALGDDAEKQDSAEGMKAATPGITVLKGRKHKDARQSPTRGKGLAVDESSCEDTPEGLRDKRQKLDTIVQDRGANKMATTEVMVMRSTRQGLRRSGCPNANKYLNATDDRASPIRDASASEDATEGVGNETSREQHQHKDGLMLAESLAADAEIRAVVRDILFKDIIARQDVAKITDADEVNDRSHDARIIKQGTSEKRKFDHTEKHLAKTDGATLTGQGIKQSGSTVKEVKPYHAVRRTRKGNVTPMKMNTEEQEAGNVCEQAVNEFSDASDHGEDDKEKAKTSHASPQVVKKVYTRSAKEASANTKQVASPETLNYDTTENTDGSNHTTASSNTAAEGPGKLSARQIRIMQSLALIAPSGSPFGRHGLVATTHR